MVLLLIVSPDIVVIVVPLPRWTGRPLAHPAMHAMTDPPAYVILGRGHWAKRMHVIIAGENRKVRSPNLNGALVGMPCRIS